MFRQLRFRSYLLTNYLFLFYVLIARAIGFQTKVDNDLTFTIAVPDSPPFIFINEDKGFRGYGLNFLIS